MKNLILVNILASLAISAVAQALQTPPSKLHFTGAEARVQRDALSAKQAFEQEHAKLAVEHLAFLQTEPTELHIQAWQENRAARYAAQQQRAILMANLEAPLPPQQPYIQTIDIPAEASPTMEEFLVKRAQLQNAQIQSDNALHALTSASARKAEREALTTRNAKLLEEMQTLAVQLGEESACEEIPLLPEEPNLPVSASPELRAFLIARHTLHRAEIQQRNATRHLLKEQRELAMHQWHEDHTKEFQAIQIATIEIQKFIQRSYR